MQQPDIETTGTPYHRGLSHGSRLREAIHRNLENFWSACRAVGLDKPALIREAGYLVQEYSETLIEEIRGIAQGAGIGAGEALAFNLCHGRVFADECTVLFALGDATASGKTLFLKNSDKIGADSMIGPNFYQHKEINVVLVVRSDDGPDIVGVSAAGSAGLKMGVSNLGVAAGANIARTVELESRKVDTTQMRALDRVQLVREGLSKRTALEAANYVAARLSENPTATPGNIEFVDSASGVIVEGSYDRVALHVVKSGVASRANSFVVLKELNNPTDVSSCCRYVRTQQLLQQNWGKLDAQSMKEFSRDHTHGPGPNSICRHGSHYTEETSQSSMVVEIDGKNPGQTRFWIALGKPCHAWRQPGGSIEGTLNQLADIPEGFLNGDVWKRYWVEEPYVGTEVRQAG